MLRRLLFGNPYETRTEIEGVVQEIDDNESGHNFDEVQILSGHNDIVDLIINIDDQRILTTGQDKKGIVWDCKTGKMVCELVGHKRAITAAIIIRKYLDSIEDFSDVIVTASSDEAIKIWDVLTGRCKRTITEHKGTVKCFSIGRSEPCVVITAGQDICLWDASFNLLAIFQRNSLDYIHSAIFVKTDRIVVATDQPTLVVYNVPTLNDDDDVSQQITECKKLLPHRESVTALTLVSDAIFTSASMDGGIIIWTTHRLVATRKFNHYDNFMNITDHTYPYSVQHLMVAESHYVLAAIGCGFAIFDARFDDSKKCIARVTNAHHSQVTALALLNKGKYLATASLDGTVRLWSGVPLDKDVAQKEQPMLKSLLSRLFERNLSEVKRFPLPLHLVGQCYAHSNSVKGITECGNEGFVSFDNDGLVILWKDSLKKRLGDDKAIRMVLEKLGWNKTNS
ncbi:WD repeat-containing protein 41-like [Clytia hemisphaerica]|uniref:Uncharacterized protein n=1 Tax=Clytia hemisphaerica TaxID=252671 RepID=A0A7M5VDK4_9CNID|eukprot:TCONS_00022813-protein